MKDLKPNSADWREQNKVTGRVRVREQPYEVNIKIIGCVRATLCSRCSELDSDWLTFGAWPEWCGGVPAAQNKFWHLRIYSAFFPPERIREPKVCEGNFFCLKGEGQVCLSFCLCNSEFSVCTE